MVAKIQRTTVITSCQIIGNKYTMPPSKDAFISNVCAIFKRIILIKKGFTFYIHSSLPNRLLIDLGKVKKRTANPINIDFAFQLGEAADPATRKNNARR